MCSFTGLPGVGSDSSPPPAEPAPGQGGWGWLLPRESGIRKPLWESAEAQGVSVLFLSSTPLSDRGPFSWSCRRSPWPRVTHSDASRAGRVTHMGDVGGPTHLLTSTALFPVLLALRDKPRVFYFLFSEPDVVLTICFLNGVFSSILSIETPFICILSS